MITLLGAFLLFGIALPVGVIQYLVIPGFFPDGSFSPDLFYSWNTFQIIAAIVLTILFFAFEIYATITIINIIKEFVRRRRVKSYDIMASEPTSSSNYYEQEY